MKLWEVETAFYIEQEFPPEVARWLTIVRWMVLGDLRPLAQAIREGDVDPAVLQVLADMIDDDRLVVPPLKRGPPKNPELFARNLIAALRYDAQSGGSAAVVREIANELCVSEQTVRAAVTRLRKFKKNQ